MQPAGKKQSTKVTMYRPKKFLQKCVYTYVQLAKNYFCNKNRQESQQNVISQIQNKKITYVVRISPTSHLVTFFRFAVDTKCVDLREVTRTF